MEANKYITMNGASYLGAYVQSFESEKEFVTKHLKDLNYLPEKEAKALLKSIHKAAKK